MYNWAQSSTPSNLGPGTYEVLKPIGKKDQMKSPFNGGAAFTSIPVAGRDAPPVGQYNPQDKMQVGAPKYSFSKSKRVIFDISNTPSPTNYSHLDSWIPKDKTPSRIVPPRPEKKYFINPQIQKNVEDGIRESSQIPSRGSEWLGPGTYNTYNLENAFHPKYTLSIAKSRPMSSLITVSKSDAPGPGTYDVVQRPSKILHEFAPLPNYEVKHRREQSIYYSGPTPWAYASDVKSSAFRSKSERFPKQPIDDNPGPGAYFQNSQPIKLPPKSFSTIPTSLHSPLTFSEASTPGNTSRPGPVHHTMARSASAALANPSIHNMDKKFSVITRTSSRERCINLDSPEQNTFWMVEEENNPSKRPRLVQKGEV